MKTEYSSHQAILDYEISAYGGYNNNSNTTAFNATKYETPGNFHDSQFVVLCNRFIAVLISASVLLLVPRSMKVHHRSPPLYEYSFASFAFIISSWCQFEALKFISSSAQAMGKAFQILPILYFGKYILHKTYAWHEYVTGFIISVSVAVFIYTTDAIRIHSKTEPARLLDSPGLVLILGYLIFHGFTANWQARLFQRYGMTLFQMVAGVNIFSFLFAVVSEGFTGLIQLLATMCHSLLRRVDTDTVQGHLIRSVTFALQYPAIWPDILLNSVFSATGQIFGFWTLKWFGVSTLAIMLTIRYVIFIFAYSIAFNADLPAVSVMAVIWVFFGIFSRLHLLQSDQIHPKVADVVEVINSAAMTTVANGVQLMRRDERESVHGESTNPSSDRRPLVPLSRRENEKSITQMTQC